jgi:biopolymer transport protein TolR
VQGELVADMQQIRDPATQVIEPLRAVLERPMLAADPAAAGALMAAREITVLADKSLPYEVVKKVMATCTAATYGKMSLAVMEREAPAKTGGRSQA